jgi:hypothetical protein
LTKETECKESYINYIPGTEVLSTGYQTQRFLFLIKLCCHDSRDGRGRAVRKSQEWERANNFPSFRKLLVEAVMGLYEQPNVQKSNC